MERESQALIAAQQSVTELDPAFLDFKSNLSTWVSSALREPSRTVGLTRLCHELKRAMARGEVVLPESLCAAQPDRYARRLIWEDPVTGVCAIAMVWGPGQGTPLHDHAGLWGVEAVLEGEIETTPYHLYAWQNKQYYFQAAPAERLAASETDFLGPPFEHHVTRNVSREVAITINIYGGAMSACNIFLPSGPGSYICQRRTQSYSE
jgi:3-mercaptopropionate dioxygenase